MLADLLRTLVELRGEGMHHHAESLHGDHHRQSRGQPRDSAENSPPNFPPHHPTSPAQPAQRHAPPNLSGSLSQSSPPPTTQSQPVSVPKRSHGDRTAIGCGSGGGGSRGPGMADPGPSPACDPSRGHCARTPVPGGVPCHLCRVPLRTGGLRRGQRHRTMVKPPRQFRSRKLRIRHSPGPSLRPRRQPLVPLPGAVRGGDPALPHHRILQGLSRRPFPGVCSRRLAMPIAETCAAATPAATSASRAHCR